jgi:hypothetical protein
LFQVENLGDFGGLSIRYDGVYVELRDPSTLATLSAEEIAVLHEHHEGDLSKPVLSFPCSTSDLKKFVDFYGMTGSIDPFDLLDVIFNGIPAYPKRLDAKDIPDKPFATTERNTLLKIIGGLVASTYNTDIHASRLTNVKQVVDDLARVGVSVTEKTLSEKIKYAAEMIEKPISRK